MLKQCFRYKAVRIDFLCDGMCVCVCVGGMALLVKLGGS